MGYQHGRQVRGLRPILLKAIESRLAPLDQVGEALESRLRELQEALETMDQPVLEMLRGMADALEVDFALLFKHAAASYLQDSLLPSKVKAADDCTTWAAADGATANGQPILAKNRDYRPEHLSLQLVALAQPAQGYRYGYITSAAAPGVFSSGLNEAGLAVADTHVSSLDLGPGLPSFSLMMRLLEKHATVRSALDYLTSARRMGGSNLILADASGDMAVFEIGHQSYGVVEAENAMVVSTNHFVSPQLCSQWVEDAKPRMRGNSHRRREVVRAALMEARGRIDVTWAQTLMARHGGPLDSICRHQELEGSSVTISATVFFPATRRFWTCFGYPCRKQYQRFRVKEEKV
ncbi:MAG TPA: hypothetical protein EYH31_03030 [Anaerolineae bacterium]|nr:hypothetical protein [Anaerolineae bacterium]